MSTRKTRNKYQEELDHIFNIIFKIPILCNLSLEILVELIMLRYY